MNVTSCPHGLTNSSLCRDGDNRLVLSIPEPRQLLANSLRTSSLLWLVISLPFLQGLPSFKFLAGTNVLPQFIPSMRLHHNELMRNQHGFMGTSVSAAICTQDGHMNFEVLADRTNPPLDLDTLRLRDPTCKPVFKSPSNNMVRFHVPLNKCGTRQMVSVH